MIRYAIIRNARSRREVEAYLPDNYRVAYESKRSPCATDSIRVTERFTFVIEGEDAMGWTLDYIIQRYASGLIGCEEIDLSHPIMREVPVNTQGGAEDLLARAEALDTLADNETVDEVEYHRLRAEAAELREKAVDA